MAWFVNLAACAARIMTPLKRPESTSGR